MRSCIAVRRKDEKKKKERDKDRESDKDRSRNTNEWLTGKSIRIRIIVITAV